VQNERTAIRQENGRYLARCVYWFPTKDLTGTARPVLVVRDAEAAGGPLRDQSHRMR